MDKIDEYLKILEIRKDFRKLSTDAQEKVLAKAWKKFSKKWHPDINKSPEAEEKFKLGNEANEKLKEYIKDGSINSDFTDEDIYEKQYKLM